MRHLIDAFVDVTVEDGTIEMNAYGDGGIHISGPTKFMPDSEPHMRIRLGHEGEPKEYEDGTQSSAGDWAEATVHLDMEQAAKLHDMLGQALDEDPSVLIDNE